MSEVQPLTKRIKRTFVLPLIMTAICILNIENVIKGMRQALDICTISIIPSLFVFMVLSDLTVTLLLDEDTINIPLKFTVFVIGSICGFPIGATICDKLCYKNILSKKDAAKIIPFCNNASPAFVIGAIGVSILGSSKLGFLLYISQILSALIPMLFIKTRFLNYKFSAKKSSVTDTFFSAIEKAIFGILKTCAIICIFTVIVQLLKKYSMPYASVLLEISNGINFCISLKETNPLLAFAMCGFCCGFSGLCVHMQIKSMLKHIDIEMSYLFMCKLMQGILSFIFSLFGYYLFF